MTINVWYCWVHCQVLWSIVINRWRAVRNLCGGQGSCQTGQDHCSLKKPITYIYKVTQNLGTTVESKGLKKTWLLTSRAVSSSNMVLSMNWTQTDLPLVKDHNFIIPPINIKGKFCQQHRCHAQKRELQDPYWNPSLKGHLVCTWCVIKSAFLGQRHFSVRTPFA